MTYDPFNAMGTRRNTGSISYAEAELKTLSTTEKPLSAAEISTSVNQIFTYCAEAGINTQDINKKTGNTWAHDIYDAGKRAANPSAAPA